MTTTKAVDFDPTPTFHRSLRDLLAQADSSNIPTGVLVTLAAAPFGYGMLRDGVLHTDTVDQRQWEQMYMDLAAGAMSHAGLPAFDQVRDSATTLAESDGVVPIGIIHVRYEQPTRRLLARILQAQRDDVAIAVPEGDLLEEKRAFAASALLPPHYWGFERQLDLYHGLGVRFRLAPELHLSNAGPLPELVEIDFDDGHGFQALTYGSDHWVEYDVEGERRIVVRALYGNDSRLASFKFRVAAVTAPDPDEIFPVTAVIKHDGVEYKGRVAVYRGRGHTAISRPLMFAEGFPGGSTAQDLYDRINGWNGTSFNPDAKLADSLIARGYDLLFLLYDNGGAPLQGNAFVYLAAIQETWKRMGGTGKVVVAGGSMGGLVARYALAYAESKGVAIGNVTALLTFDSPHVGANVPLAVQAVGRFFSEAGGGAVCQLLDKPAARQMLVAQRWTWDQRESWEKDPYTKFYAELTSLGVGGYPSRINKYAVSNGAKAGTTDIPPLNAAVIWRLGAWDLPLAKAEAWCTPNGTEGTYSWCVAATIRWPGKYYPIEGTNFYTRDGCAGGVAKFFGEMADTFRRQKGAVWDPYRVNCFIPVHSALGKAVTNAYTFKASDLKPGDLPFTDWYASAANQAHATVDKGIKDWILGLFP